MKVIISAELPDELVQPWLQHMRDFDAKHSADCHFQVIVNAPDNTVDEMVEMMKIDPPLPHQIVIKRDDG